MTTMTAVGHRQPLSRPEDGLFRRCLTASSISGLAFLLVVLVAPVRRHIVTSIDKLPPRFAKLIVERHVTPGPGGELGKQPGAAGEPGPGPKDTPPGEPGPVAGAAPVPRSAGPAATSAPVGVGAGPGPDAGAAGRARAQAVTSQLATTTSALQKSLSDLSSALASTSAPTSGAPVGGRAGRARFVRGGRDAPEIASVRTDIGGVGGAAALGGSSVAGAAVAIGTLSGVGGGGDIGGGSGAGTGGGGGNGSGTGTGGGGGGGGGTGTGGGGNGGGEGDGRGGWGHGSAPGVYRSNASLLAVIQRYAAGIQYCYGNELKRDPGLHGKLVVSLTVAASGEVTEAVILLDSVGSQGLTSCALSQIRGWRFPAIDRGVTTFQAPFVFTPPN